MAEWLEALTTETPLMLVLEDLHWGDHSTLDLVSMLARRRGCARLMLCITYRPVEVILADHPLKVVRQVLHVHGDCQDLDLNYLSAGDVDAYLEKRFPAHAFPPRLATFIHERTEGNPLFMINVIDYLVARGALFAVDGCWLLAMAIENLVPGVPDNLRRMIERQIERLNPEEQDLLEAASVAGVTFTSAAIAPKADACLARLVRQEQWVCERGLEEWPDNTVSARYVFAHALYQNVLYHRQPAARRLQRHRRIGARLERAFGARSPEIALELALHFEQGRVYPKAVTYLRQAAASAAARCANREAIGYLTRALAAAQRLPIEDGVEARMALLEERGQVRRALADMEGAAEDFEALAACAREQSQFDRQAMALVFETNALAWVDRGRCLAVVAQLQGVSARIHDPRLRAHVRGWSAYWHLMWHGWRDADALACAAAVRAARHAGDGPRLNLLLGRYSYFQCLRSRYWAASHTAAEAAQLALQTGSAFEYLLAHFFWAWALLRLGEWGKMRLVLSDGIQVADKNGHGLWALLFRLELAWLSIEAFDFAMGRELAQRGLQEAEERQLGYGTLLGLVLLGLSQLGLGEHEPAFHHFQAARQKLAREGTLMAGFCACRCITA